MLIMIVIDQVIASNIAMNADKVKVFSIEVYMSELTGRMMLNIMGDLICLSSLGLL